MIIVLFGFAGVGKNHVGQILSQHSHFHFWDADEVITEEMRLCIQEKTPFTQGIRDHYFERVTAHLKTLTMQHANIIISQAFYKNKNRSEFLSQFPEAQFIQVNARFETISQRLIKRGTEASEQYLRKMRTHFETPSHPYLIIDNEIDSNPALLIAQCMTMPHIATHLNIDQPIDITANEKTLQPLLSYFNQYDASIAPFMHQHLQTLRATRPLQGLRVLHHVPVVTNTLLKIACLVEAGAEVIVTNPSFMKPDPVAVESLRLSGVRYASALEELKNETFDLYFDCGAALYQALGAPKIGAIELTGSGDHYYRQQQLNFPVISIDPTRTKQLETVFGCAVSSHTAIGLLSGQAPSQKSWIIFGFGKIGRGLAYFCRQHNTKVCIVDASEKQRAAAQQLGLTVINPDDHEALQQAISTAEIVVTATGVKATLDPYPRAWFDGKILANMGIYDEYGPKFADNDVLNAKKPVNFALKDPTPMQYIDPEFYIHNIAAFFFKQNLRPGVHELPEAIDKNILQQWVTFHNFSMDDIQQWFISPEAMDLSREKQEHASSTIKTRQEKLTRVC